jgi:hypothetical protein
VASEGTRRKEPAKALPGDLGKIRFTVGGEAALLGADTDDPGTMDWWGSATISEWPLMAMTRMSSIPKSSSRAASPYRRRTSHLVC